MLQMIFMSKAREITSKSKVKNQRDSITSNEECRKAFNRSELIRYLIQLNP